MVCHMGIGDPATDRASGSSRRGCEAHRSRSTLRSWAAMVWSRVSRMAGASGAATTRPFSSAGRRVDQPGDHLGGDRGVHLLALGERLVELREPAAAFVRVDQAADDARSAPARD